jgi:uncharacterized protein (DUF1684 family)
MKAQPSRPVSKLGVITAIAALALTTLSAGCGKKSSAIDPAYLAGIEKWRAERLASLTSDYGWLSVVGLVWLHPGENRFGSDPANDVVLPGRGTPPFAGTLELRGDGTVVLHPGPEGGLTVNGAPASERALHSDHAGKPDLLGLGPIRFYLIDRDGKLAVRVKNPHSARRTNFGGLHYFPVNPGYRVEATFKPYPQPHEVAVATVQGPKQHMLIPGLVRFTLRGQALALEPFVSSPEDRSFFFVFRDATSGSETYGAGRFLDVAIPADGSRKLVIDFNLAYTPPCAFTPYATCPLPPTQNELPIRIEAGEKFSGSH